MVDAVRGELAMGLGSNRGLAYTRPAADQEYLRSGNGGNVLI
jgi:hypothetical protein